MASTCVLFSGGCFLPTTFYYSAFQRIEGNPKVLRDGIVRTEARTERSGEANACARVLFIHFFILFLQHHRCVIAENFWWRPTWRIKALQHRWEIPLRWMRWARTVKAADKWFPNPISPTCSTFAREAFLPNKVTVIIIFFFKFQTTFSHSRWVFYSHFYLEAHAR